MTLVKVMFGGIGKVMIGDIGKGGDIVKGEDW